jgi:hypothetical protein
MCSVDLYHELPSPPAQFRPGGASPLSPATPPAPGESKGAAQKMPSLLAPGEFFFVISTSFNSGSYTYCSASQLRDSFSASEERGLAQLLLLLLHILLLMLLVIMYIYVLFNFFPSASAVQLFGSQPPSAPAALE